MREIFGNLFDQQADAICITTNGALKGDGANVMGKGCAGEAKKLWPGLDYLLGQRIQMDRNVVHCLTTVYAGQPTLVMGEIIVPGEGHQPPDLYVLNYHLLSFPVKPTMVHAEVEVLENYRSNAGSYPGWMAKAQLPLIAQSAYALEHVTDQMGWTKVVLPRPGCGAGDLRWEEVKPVLDPILDDRFAIITFAR